MVVRGGTAAKAIVVADLRATWSTLLSSQLVETSFYRFSLRAGPNIGWDSESATRYAPLITGTHLASLGRSGVRFSRWWNKGLQKRGPTNGMATKPTKPNLKYTNNQTWDWTIILTRGIGQGVRCSAVRKRVASYHGARRQAGGLGGTTVARTRSNISHHMNVQRQPTQVRYFLNQGQTGKPRQGGCGKNIWGNGISQPRAAENTLIVLQLKKARL